MKPYSSLIALFVLVPFFVSAQSDTLKTTRLPNAPVNPGQAHYPSDKSKAQLQPLRNEPVGVVAQVPDLVFDNVWTGMIIGRRFIPLINTKGSIRIGDIPAEK